MNDFKNGQCPECDKTYKRDREDTPTNLYCSTCLDTVEKREQYEKRERIFKLRVGQDYESCTFNNFVKTHESHEKLIQEVKNAVSEMDRCILLIGDVGTGKTHLLTAVYRELYVKKGVLTRFRELNEVLAEYTAAGFDELFTPEEVLTRYKTTPFLILDEASLIKSTEHQLEGVHALINYRYKNRLPIILAGNFEVTENSLQGIYESVSRILGKPVADRVLDAKWRRIFVLPSESYRLMGQAT